MKTSHKSDELKKKLKRGGPQIGYLWSVCFLTIVLCVIRFMVSGNPFDILF